MAKAKEQHRHSTYGTHRRGIVNWGGSQTAPMKMVSVERRREFREECIAATGKTVTVQIDRATTLRGRIIKATVSRHCRKAGAGWAPLANVTIEGADGTKTRVVLSAFAER